MYISFVRCLIQFSQCFFFRNRLRNAADSLRKKMLYKINGLTEYCIAVSRRALDKNLWTSSSYTSLRPHPRLRCVVTPTFLQDNTQVVLWMSWRRYFFDFICRRSGKAREISGSDGVDYEGNSLLGKPRSLTEVDRHFRGAYWLHHQGSTSTRLHGAYPRRLSPQTVIARPAVSRKIGASPLLSSWRPRKTHPSKCKP
jgi:hypothetical protein